MCALIKKPEESYSQLGANVVRCLEKWIEQENVTSPEEMKIIIGLEQFYLILPGDLRYLGRDKKTKNVQETSETADYINDIWNPTFSKLKLVGKCGMTEAEDPEVTSGIIKQLEAILKASPE